MIRDVALALVFAAFFAGCSGSDEPLGNDPSGTTTQGDDDQPLDDGDHDLTDGHQAADGDVSGDVDSAQFCNALDAKQDHCGAWTERDKRDACDMSDEQAQCITDVLTELEARGTSSCVYPHAMLASCVGGKITNIGIANCFIEECLGLTTADACVGDYVILCSYLP